jgi:hypothetical protein
MDDNFIGESVEHQGSKVKMVNQSVLAWQESFFVGAFGSPDDKRHVAANSLITSVWTKSRA